MQAQRYVAFVKPELMAEARASGMMNFSGFVNESLKEYIAEQRANLRQNDSDTATASARKEAAL